MEQKNNSNKNLIVIVASIAGLIVFIFISMQFFKGSTPDKPQVTETTGDASFFKTLSNAASELNKSCPMMIDQDTRLDNAMALSENLFQYNYTMVNYAKEDMDIGVLKQNLEPGIVNSVKSNPDLKVYRDHKVTMAYNYKDKHGTFIMKIEVTPEMYEQNP